MQLPVSSTSTNTSMLDSLVDRTMLEHDFEAMVAKREQASNTLKARMENREVMKEMKNSFHALEKRMSEKVSAEQGSLANQQAIKIRKEKARLMNILGKVTDELKRTSNSQTLFKVVQEEKSREEKYESTIRYVHTLKEAVSRLEKEIDEERQQHAAEESASHETLHALKEEYQRIKSHVSVSQRFEESESNAQFHTRVRVNAIEEGKLQKHLMELRESADRENKAFSLSESFLRRKQEAAERQLTYWQNKYNTDLKGIIDKLEKLQIAREKLLVELRTSEEALQRELLEKQVRDQEHARRLQEQQHRLKSIVIVQSIVRRFLARKKYLQMRAELKKSTKKTDKKKK